MSTSRDLPTPKGPSAFATTRWSVVAAAGEDGSPSARAALATLCETYWYPLYVFIRRRGASPEEAQDLTQGFLTHLLEKSTLESANPEGGRFRSFLLTAFKRFVSKEHARANALKRGGGVRTLSLDLADGERRYHLEPAHDTTPERIFERRWALTVLARVLEQLQEQFERAGKQDHFDAFKGYLTGEEGNVPYREKAAALGMAEGAVKVAVHRLRKRYREVLRHEIAQTVADPADVNDELERLLTSLAPD